MSVPFMTRWRWTLEEAHIDHGLLTPLEHSIAVAFARYANPDGTSITVSHRTVAAKLRVDVDTIGKAMRKMQRMGLFDKVRKASGGRGRTDSSGEYRCAFPQQTPDPDAGSFAETPDKHPTNTRSPDRPTYVTFDTSVGTSYIGRGEAPTGMDVYRAICSLEPEDGSKASSALQASTAHYDVTDEDFHWFAGHVTVALLRGVEGQPKRLAGLVNKALNQQEPLCTLLGYLPTYVKEIRPVEWCYTHDAPSLLCCGVIA